MTAPSKIGICNIALAMLGGDSIRDFDEENKRSRQCDIFYESTVAYLMEQYDWSFARKFVDLQAIVEPVPAEGLYPYQLPSDCLIPREVAPRASRNYWEIIGRTIYTRCVEAQLYYTRNDYSVDWFSHTFENLAATGIAVKLSPAISQKPDLTAQLFNQFLAEQRDAHAVDANIGNEYRAYDETPEVDTFVNPPGTLVDFLGNAT